MCYGLLHDFLDTLNFRFRLRHAIYGIWIDKGHYILIVVDFNRSILSKNKLQSRSPFLRSVDFLSDQRQIFFIECFSD